MADNKYTKEGKKRKIQYIRNYNKKTYRSVNIMFRIDDPKQAELWEFLHSKYSTAGFLRDLAFEAMEKDKKKKGE